MYMAEETDCGAQIVMATELKKWLLQYYTSADVSLLLQVSLHTSLQRAFRKTNTGPEGGTLKNIGRGVLSASHNPYSIYDQNLQFSPPYYAYKPVI